MDLSKHLISSEVNRLEELNQVHKRDWLFITSLILRVDKVNETTFSPGIPAGPGLESPCIKQAQISTAVDIQQSNMPCG